MIKRVKVYLHRTKESNWELAQKLGFEEDSEAFKNVCYLGYELEAYYDVDLQTGETKFVGADGFFLGYEAVTSGEIEVSDD